MRLFEAVDQHPDHTHVAGGRNAETGMPRPEEYIPGPEGRAGSAYPDLTFEDAERMKHRVNTVDTLADGVTPTTRELANEAKINRLKPDDPPIVTIPKPKPRPPEQ